MKYILKKYQEGGPIVPDPKKPPLPGVKEPVMTAKLAAALTAAAKKEPLSLEGKVNAALGDPKGRAAEFANTYGGDEGAVDNVRHPLAAAYTTEAVANKVKSVLGNTPEASIIGKAVGFAFSNAAGAAHEVKALPSLIEEYYKENGITGVFNAIRMTGEDTFNNFVGSVIGALPQMKGAQKEEIITYLSDNNLLPDGVESSDGKRKLYLR